MREHHHHDHDHDHDHQHDHDHEHDHHDHHHHDSELKGHLSFVYGAAICLVIGGGIHFLRPDQAELAALWSMIGAALAAIPIIQEALEGAHSKAAENTEFYSNQFILLAVAACFVTGQYVTGGLVAIILMVGHVFEDRSMLGVNEAINSLMNLSRARGRRLINGIEEEVDAEDLRKGDVIRIRPGDTIPADGTVILGHSTVNQANITGESLPVEIVERANVFAGTTNLTGMVEVVVTKAGEETLLGRVKKIVEEAQTTRAPIVRLTEQYAHYYMPLILLLAGFVLFFTHDIQRSISVIIVSIPCAFILAGPTAMVAALAASSRMGMLVKSVQFFEAANELDTVVFDKTGTLTTGQLEVFQVDLHGALSRDEVLSLASSLESHSTHPIAQAIVGFTSKSGLMIQEAKRVFEDHGLGMEGSVNGGSVLVGRFSWIESKGLTLVSSGELSQFSAIYVALNESHVGTIYLSDSIRKEARDVQHNLREAGISRFLMLTGDRSGAAEAIAAEIGFSEYQADCLPEQKLEVVKSLKEEGHNVLVVGDGVNDAPALAAGNLSIAMGALGSDVAIKTADIALMSNDLSRVAQFINLSKKTVRVINQNILSGFLFSTVAIILSSAGYVSPMVACFIHEFGAFFVIFNSARLLKFDGR